MNNNPVKYDDPSGNDVGCGGRDLSECAPMPQLKQPPVPPGVKTNAIYLSGGPGTTSYNQSAEDTWTGYSGSGESGNPTLDGRVNGLGLGNDSLAWLRDNTQIRAPGSEPDVSGEVYYETNASGWKLTGASVNNTSYEVIAIQSIKIYEYSYYDNQKISSQKLYPYPYPSIQTEDYGIAGQGLSSGIIRVESRNVPNYHYLDIEIRVISETGRFGGLGLRLSINPPKP